MLPLLLLLSGFAGISYEILYGRLLGNLLGDQFAVSASVLITFLLGAGLGSAYAHRFKAWLWLIELSIGLFGVLFALSYDGLEHFIYSQNTLTQNLSGKIAICSVLLMIPAFLVGCSVPLFSALWAAQEKNSQQFAHVYGVYNVGAALTALGLEFILIRLIGIQDTLWLFALVNFAIAGCLRFALPPVELKVAALDTAANQVSRRVRWALIIASIGSAIFQLYMIKLTELIFGPFRENFALVLAVVLAGIALGSLLCKRFKMTFSTLMLINVIGLVFILIALPAVVRFYAFFYPLAANFHASIVLFKLFILLVLMALPALTFGATVPALLQSEQQVAKESGYLLFISALANSAGFLIMAFLLHPYLDFGVQLLIIISLSLSAWLLYHAAQLRQFAQAGAVMLLFIGLHWGLWQENLLYLSYIAFQSIKELDESKANLSKIESFKGNQDIFAISEIDGTAYFFINGYISFPLNAYHEKIVGLLGAMFAPRTDDALVLGLGSGSTASVVGLTFDNTDAVDINPLVRANLYRLKEWNLDIDHNPRVSFVVDDAIHFVRSTPKSYSLILNTVTSPLYFSSSKLYTADFFHAVKQRLRPDGIYATWVDSRIGDRGFDIIIKTLRASFKECGLFYIKNTYFLLLCGETPLVYAQQHLQARAPRVWAEFTQKYNLLPDFMAYNLLTTKAFTLLEDESVPVNRLDFPALENEMASLAHDGLPRVKERVASQMNVDEVKRVVAPDVTNWNPADLVVEAEQTITRKYIMHRWRDLVKQIDANYEADHDSATLAYFRRVAEIGNNAEAYHNYGNALLKRQRYDDALAQFKRAIALDDSNANTYFNMGVCYEQLGDRLKALVNYKKALNLEPDDEDILRHLDKLYQLNPEWRVIVIK